MGETNRLYRHYYEMFKETFTEYLYNYLTVFNVINVIALSAF